MEGFFIDIQGTLIDDKDFLPLPGSVEFLKYLNQNSIPFVLITNNTKRKPSEFKNYLKNLGFEFEHYIDPLSVLGDYVKGKKTAPYGQDRFIEIISEMFEVDYKNPDAVLLGIRLYDPETQSRIVDQLLNGAELIGMHKTSIYSNGLKRYPGLGAVLEMFKYAVGRDYVTVGKPSFEFFEKARGYLGLNYDKITIISDDLIGDLLPAGKLGMKTVLVLSGKIKSQKEITRKPDFVFENLANLLEYWRENGRETEKTQRGN